MVEGIIMEALKGFDPPVIWGFKPPGIPEDEPKAVIPVG